MSLLSSSHSKNTVIIVNTVVSHEQIICLYYRKRYKAYWVFVSKRRHTFSCSHSVKI